MFPADFAADNLGHSIHGEQQAGRGIRSLLSVLVIGNELRNANATVIYERG